MKPEAILDRVQGAIDVLVEVGDRYGGLFPSLIDLETHEMLVDMPPAIEGQRVGDRSHLGSNLIHDEAALMTMYALDRPGYTEAADRYIHRFATHCTDTTSGLYPWGEHAYWHLLEDRPANSYLLRAADGSNPNLTHDHLRAVPLWLWQKLSDASPWCIERFGEGLDNHWVDIEPLEYIRHARIDEVERHPAGKRSCDFPRHSGFYIWDFTFAYVQSDRLDFLDQIETFLDYWWERREPDGLCWTESRTQPEDMLHRMKGVAQTLSLATSLLESADLLEELLPQAAEVMRARAHVYTNGFLGAPHRPDEGLFLNGYHGDSGEPSPMAIWGSVYGKTPASYAALVCLCNHRLSETPGLLEWAAAVGRCYLTEPFPRDAAVPAMDAGMGIGLLADLYDVTGEDAWLTGGLSRAEELVSIYFGDAVLPSGASGIDWYESQMGPSFLLHGLARLALLAQHGRDCPLGPDYTGR